MYNLPGLETAVKEEVGQSLLTRVGKYHVEDIPDLTVINAVFH
jgi:hypothetical protein